jgi:hypothetical protein
MALISRIGAQQKGSKPLKGEADSKKEERGLSTSLMFKSPGSESFALELVTLFSLVAP